MKSKIHLILLIAIAVSAVAKDANSVFSASRWDEKNGSLISGTNGPRNDCITGIGSGDYTCYNNVDFGDGSYDVFMATIAVPSDAAGKSIEIRLDGSSGTRIGTLTLSETYSPDIFQEHYTPIAPVSGTHDVYLVFPEAMSAELNWFVFGVDPGIWPRTETESERSQRMKWWKEARFGQFIHWGAYSHLEGDYGDWQCTKLCEWAMVDYRTDQIRIPLEEYTEIAARPLNPTAFNAKVFVDRLVATGQKYLVITAKHHEGFCMYDTDVEHFDPYDIVDWAEYGQDPIAALEQECGKQGVRFGVYYSIADWRLQHTKAAEWGNEYPPRYASLMKEQLMELIDRYDIDLLWFDAGFPSELRTYWHTTGEAGRIYRFVRTLKSDLIVNDRAGILKGQREGDYYTPEATIPAYRIVDYDWETCMSIAGSWGYSKYDTWRRDARLLVNQLCAVTSKGGNYLLNIGPDKLGNVQDDVIARMDTIGRWMSTNGECIYGAEASPYPEPWTNNEYWCTHKPGTLFFAMTSWPASGELTVPGFQNDITGCYILGDTQNQLSYSKNGDSLKISLPSQMPDSLATVIAVEYSGELELIDPILTKDPSPLVLIDDFEDGDMRCAMDSKRDWIKYAYAGGSASIDWQLKTETDRGTYLQADFTLNKPVEGQGYPNVAAFFVDLFPGWLATYPLPLSGIKLKYKSSHSNMGSDRLFVSIISNNPNVGQNYHYVPLQNTEGEWDSLSALWENFGQLYLSEAQTQLVPWEMQRLQFRMIGSQDQDSEGHLAVDDIYFYYDSTVTASLKPKRINTVPHTQLFVKYAGSGIKFDWKPLGKRDEACIYLYDPRGRKIFEAGPFPSDRNSFIWKTGLPHSLVPASGMLICRLTIGKKVVIAPLLITQ